MISLSIIFLALFELQFCSASIVTESITETKEKVEAIADGVLKDATFQFIDRQGGNLYNDPGEAPPNSMLRIKSPYNDWRYWNGVLGISMIKLGDVLNKPEYSEFAAKNIEFNFEYYKYFKDKYNNEDKWSYTFGQHIIMQELDDYGAMGGSLIEVYKNNPKQIYRDYIDSAADYVLNKQGRMEDDTLVRTFPVKWTLWADDLYMSISFLSRMGELTGDLKYFNDAAKQVINFNKYLFNTDKGLMYHCWYSDTKKPGVAFWGRANGWALVAQVDLLDRLPENFPQREELLKLLRRHIDGIIQYQDKSGLWHQLLDKNDSFLETSCSAMFSYTIARAVEKGYIEKDYASVAQRGWEGVMTKIRADGKVEGVCTGTGVGDNLEFYYNRPTPLNDVHGIGTVLLAGAEILRLSNN